jgi:hypothetical protein
MVESSIASPTAVHEGHAVVADQENVFLSRFTEEERHALMTEDREAQLSICAILACLIATGMCLGILSVFLVKYLGI